MRLFTVPQASDSAKEAEDNARKAKNAVKIVLNNITALLEQLGKNRIKSNDVSVELVRLKVFQNQSRSEPFLTQTNQSAPTMVLCSDATLGSVDFHSSN